MALPHDKSKFSSSPSAWVEGSNHSIRSFKINAERRREMKATMTAVDEFQRAMEERSLACPDAIIGDGLIHRFTVPGDSPGSKNGYYLLHDDEHPAGLFGSWRTGEKIAWRAKGRDQTYQHHGTRYKKANLHYKWPWRKQVKQIMLITETRGALASDFLERVKAINHDTLTDEQRDHLLEKIFLAQSWIRLAESAADWCGEIAKRMHSQERKK